MTPEQNTPTAHQLEWDKRNRALTIRNLCILIPLAAAAATVLAITVSTVLIPSATGRLDLDGVLDRAGFLILATTVLFLATIPAGQYMGTARWILGERPADDFNKATV